MLHNGHIAITTLTAAVAILLAYLFYYSSHVNTNPFTKSFLKLLAAASVIKFVEVCAAAYRSGRIEPTSVSLDAAIVGLAGRGLEFVVCAIMAWFLLRPETKRALNGSSK